MGVRTHIVLPKELLEKIDAVCGKRGRSAFIEEAIRTQLSIEKQRRAIEIMRMEGPDAPVWYMPGLEDYDDVSDFIHDQRLKESEQRMKRLGLGPDGNALPA